MLRLRFSQRALRFNFPARTSRGALAEHVAWYLHLADDAAPDFIGLGEAAPLAGLSPDYGPDFPAAIAQLCARFNAGALATFAAADAPAFVGPGLPALTFALETAALDLARGGRRQLYANAFSEGRAALPINGLVWMGDAPFMREQIRQKLAAGYSCLKLKIGSLDFATELELLAEIRAVAGPERLVLRVDANGAFAPADAPAKLAQLAAFHLHSIEQPIAAGQAAALGALCRTSPLPIALDEELIGVTEPARQAALLDEIRPAYIVLKPTLLGGHAATRRWIALAEARGIGWWITSALESNVGLNAVAQLTGEYDVQGFAQGLGTGQLYHNNVAAPLHVGGGALRYDPAGAWELPA
ncbi:o-succinylbenzoate synthase [Hymenobacter properus]|uniref:O-succinylbenzoate synthase n=1 Tax=Hymenobacter properus TaxID=2791026 RepID=A0A931BR50_9BACT|nr:o-succinylbenzoate synthase [Hymenobacter properus]MBF9144070.1 o-succinylbenzoate synthase [Hymenobacter properus]MBR7722886.1 o-succinylbenzoate synthase [Microvirga sp. SRT04]